MKHLRENNETYFSHLKFACGMGLSLFFRGAVFFVHGLLPAITVPRTLDLEAMAKKMAEWKEHTRKRMTS